MVGKTILPATVAQPFIIDLNKTITEEQFKVRLVGSNRDPAAEKYAEWTMKSCEATGVKFDLVKLNRESLEETIISANEDPTIHGIIVYYPVLIIK